MNDELFSTFYKKLDKEYYEFDKKLKNIIMNEILDIELMVKYCFCNNFINRYSDNVDELFNQKNYSNNNMVNDILERLKKQLEEYPPLEKSVYSYIKNISFGLIRDLLFISKPNDKDHICKKLTNEKISSNDLDTILEFLVKTRNICCHHELLYSFINNDIQIPTTKYHKYFINDRIQHGKKDFLASLISIKLLVDKNTFSILIDKIDELINESNISRNQLLYEMHLPSNYTKLKNQS